MRGSTATPKALTEASGKIWAYTHQDAQVMRVQRPATLTEALTISMSQAVHYCLKHQRVFPKLQEKPMWWAFQKFRSCARHNSFF